MKNKIFKLTYFFLAVIFFASCSSVKVISDMDPTEDFTKIKTYEYWGWAEDSDQALTRFDRERIEKAFGAEATKRGLTLVEDNGDAIVSLYVTGQVRTQKTATTTTMGMGGAGMGRRGMGGPGWGWGGGMAQSHTTYNETEYLEGTLAVQMFSKAEKELIWLAYGIRRVSEDPKKRERDIPMKVEAIMKKYPVKPIK